MKKSLAEADISHFPLTTSRPELLIDDSDEVFCDFLHGILALSERWNTVRAGFGERLGLSGIQYTILISIAHMQKYTNVSVKRLADHLHLSGTFVTTVTGQLEKANLIHKKQDAEDRRKVRLVISEEGKTLLRKLEDTQQKVNDEMFECLDQEQFKDLSKLVDELILCADRAITLQTHLNMRQKALD